MRRMLRSGLAAAILTVIGVAHTAEQQVVEMTIPPEVLKAQLLESSKHTLPEFMAFTGDGKRIFQKRGMSTGFIASLEASLKKKKALTGKQVCGKPWERRREQTVAHSIHRWQRNTTLCSSSIGLTGVHPATRNVKRSRISWPARRR